MRMTILAVLLSAALCLSVAWADDTTPSATPADGSSAEPVQEAVVGATPVDESSAAPVQERVFGAVPVDEFSAEPVPEPVLQAVRAEVPGLMNFQGTLTDVGGVALDTTVSMTFSIYPTSVGGAAVWTETQPAVVVSSGIFNVLLGSVNPIPDAVFSDPVRWLGIQVGVDPELAARQRIAAVGYSFRAAQADTAEYAKQSLSDGDWTISGSDMYSAVPGYVGIGTASPLYPLDVQGDNTFLQVKSNVNWAGVIIDKYDASQNGYTIYRTGGSDRWVTGLMGDDNYRIHYWPTATDAMYINSSGNVGIGRNTPGAKLDCPGPVRIGETTFTPASVVGLVLVANDNSFSSIPLAIVNTDTDYLMYVRGNGDVGIGTYSPAAKLDVVGTAKMTGFALPTGAGSGKVLTSDASGNGTWQAGFTGLWSDHTDWIEPNIAGNFEIYENSTSWVGLSFVGGTETDAITNWSNDGASIHHCYNTGTNLYGVDTYASSSLTDYGVESYGQEWGGYFTTAGTAVRGVSASSTRFGDLGTPAYGVYGQYDSDTYGYLGSSLYGAYGRNGDNYGYIGGPSYGVYVQRESDQYAILGYSTTLAHYLYHRELVATGDGQAVAYAYRTRDAQNDGTGYGLYTANQGLLGYSYWGDLYSFGTSGYNYNDYTRCGGVLGAYNSGTYWGSLGYKNSGGSTYGGYFTSYTSGTGKGDRPAVGVGLGAWGDLFGADIHGKVYGVYAEGGEYGLYSHGHIFRDALDVHLQHQSDRNSTVLYTNVSTDVTVQTSGFVTLSGGKSTISFDDNFRQVVSAEVPVVVTVTPTGPCQGVYVFQVTKDGFTVVENNGGKSDVQVAFIAVGRRAGYENPQLPAEVVSAEYVDKLSRGLHNDADTQSDGQGLFFEDGQLVVGVHPSTLPDPNKPAEELQLQERVAPSEVPSVLPAEVRMERPVQGNVSVKQVRTRQSD